MQKNEEKEDLEEAGLLAYTEISMCHLNDIKVNEPKSFLCPMTQFQNPDVDP